MVVPKLSIPGRNTYVWLTGMLNLSISGRNLIKKIMMREEFRISMRQQRLQQVPQQENQSTMRDSEVLPKRYNCWKDCGDGG